MPIIPFMLDDKNQAKMLKKVQFQLEKELQSIIENNLEEFFGITFLASEYTTSKKHGGRMDTLGIDENNSPVILEYKRNSNQNIINQALFYLDWLVDHKSAFEILVRDTLNKKIEIDWSSPRVLCIAEEFNKYDSYGVEQMKRPIELIQYSYFENNLITLDLLTTEYEERISNVTTTEVVKKDYGIADHKKKGTKKTNLWFEELREFIIELGDDIKESPRKFYIAYRVIRNFICIEIHKNHLLLYLTLNQNLVDLDHKYIRDVKDIGHYGTGDIELRIESIDEIDIAKEMILMAYKNSNI